MKLQIDIEKFKLIAQELSTDLNEGRESSEVPICEYEDEFGDKCQLKLVATKDIDHLISGGKQFHCLSLKEE